MVVPDHGAQMYSVDDSLSSQKSVGVLIMVIFSRYERIYSDLMGRVYDFSTPDIDADMGDPFLLFRCSWASKENKVTWLEVLDSGFHFMNERI